jgi:catechol 2,3-dioxygenase-like lactoylglutathione lyase family enzyme
MTTAPRNIIRRLDHAFLSTPSPDKLFHFFSEVLELPVNWPCEDYGPFRTGGFYAGNINIELMRATIDPWQSATVGLGFEPEELSLAVRNLEARGIAHKLEQPYVLSYPAPLLPDSPFISEVNAYLRAEPDQRGTVWSVVYFPEMMKPSTLVFGCQYHLSMLRVKYRLLQRLLELQGRPDSLGGERVKEITLGVEDLGARRRQWQELLGVPDRDGRLTPGDAGDVTIHLVQSEKEGALGFVVKVASLERARSFLVRRNIDFAATDRAFADPT